MAPRHSLCHLHGTPDVPQKEPQAGGVFAVYGLGVKGLGYCQPAGRRRGLSRYRLR
jgi:hypothetical protein